MHQFCAEMLVRPLGLKDNGHLFCGQMNVKVPSRERQHHFLWSQDSSTVQFQASFFTVQQHDIVERVLDGPQSSSVSYSKSMASNEEKNEMLETTERKFKLKWQISFLLHFRKTFLKKEVCKKQDRWVESGVIVKVRGNMSREERRVRGFEDRRGKEKQKMQCCHLRWQGRWSK